MKIKHVMSLVLILACCAAAPATQPTAAELAIARPLLAEADKQAAALGDRLAAAHGNFDWLLAHVRAGDWASAKPIIEATSPASRARLYERALLEAANVGDMDLAQQIVDQQLPGDPGRTLIAAAKARQGDLTAATAALKTISNPIQRFNLLSALATAQLKSGDRAAATASCQEMAENAKADHNRVQLEFAVRMMAQAGDVDAARKLVADVQDQMLHDRDVAAMAEGQALAGDIDGFKATISPLPDADQASAFRVAGMDLARQGEVAPAERVLALCNDASTADLIRGQIAIADVRAGNVPAALATAADIASSPTAQLQAYAAICRAQFLAGDPTGAAHTLALAHKSNDHAAATQPQPYGIQLAYVQAASGDAAGAIKAIQDATTDPAELLLAYATAARMELTPP